LKKHKNHKKKGKLGAGRNFGREKGGQMRRPRKKFANRKTKKIEGCNYKTKTT